MTKLRLLGLVCIFASTACTSIVTSAPTPIAVSPTVTIALATETAVALSTETSLPLMATAHRNVATLRDALPVRQNTDATNHLGPDGYPWAHTRPFLVDKYGKILVWAQKASGAGDGPVRPIVSSDGVRWTEPARVGFRDSEGEEASFGPPMVAYDWVNDVIHTLWSTGSNPSDGGIFYRRYGLQRDSNHDVTAVTRVSSLILDNTGSDYATTQSLLWLNDPTYGTFGALFALWSVTNSTGTPNKTEVRASMVILDNVVIDADTASHWSAPATRDSTTNGVSPAVAYTRIYASPGGNVFPAVYRKIGGANANDIYVCLVDEPDSRLSLRRLPWNAATGDWTAGPIVGTTITKLVRAGIDAGYSYKNQLLSQITEDLTDDLLAVAFSSWKDDTSGDSWSFVTIDPKRNDAVSNVTDVYSAGVAWSGSNAFVTGDIAWDSATNLFVITYSDLPRKDGYVAVYNPSGALVDGPLVFHDASPIDIPTLSSVRFKGRIAILYRDYNVSSRNQPPIYDPTSGYQGWFCTVQLSS